MAKGKEFTRRRGDAEPVQNCTRCAERCPLALRQCRTCQHFKSDVGARGVCALSGECVDASLFCDAWEARV